MYRRLAAAMLLILNPFGMRPLEALETDQYWAWGHELGDSTDVVNAKLNLEMERAIASFDHPPEECIDVAIHFRKKMRFVLFHHIQLWALNSELVERFPDADQDAVYRETNLYRNRSFFDPGMWMTITPTIEVNGVRIGTDKLSHFVSSGWTYYGSYQRALRHGATPQEAERAAVRRGVLEERLILGAAGILSMADLEANFQGLRFYLDLCSGDDPILVREGASWSLSRAIDLRDYVHPGWDESFRSSIFRDGRWRKVKPALEQYCSRRSDPQVEEMMARYRATERRTVAQEVVDELVSEGRLPDPTQFSLDANCSDLEGGDREGIAPTQRPTDARRDRATDLTDPTKAILAEEREVASRRYGLTSLRVAYPQVASISLGLLATRLPRTYDCRTPCDLWGPFAQLEPGLRGGKLSLGWGRVIAERRTYPILSNVFLALGIKGTVFRSWGSDSDAPPNQTYLGAEFEFSIARANAGVGALRRVDGDRGDRWIITGHLGWGF
jgi:hypothetical protein